MTKLLIPKHATLISKHPVYRNTNLSMGEIGRKIGFSKSATCKFLSSLFRWNAKNKPDREHNESLE